MVRHTRRWERFGGWKDGRQRPKQTKDPRLGQYANKWEQQYATYLEVLKKTGEIGEWRYEPFRLHLGHRQSYTPDFVIMLPDSDRLEIHEVKGVWREDAREKWKTAITLYAVFFEFIVVTKHPQFGNWLWENETRGVN